MRTILDPTKSNHLEDVSQNLFRGPNFSHSRLAKHRVRPLASPRLYPPSKTSLPDQTTAATDVASTEESLQIGRGPRRPPSATERWNGTWSVERHRPAKPSGYPVGRWMGVLNSRPVTFGRCKVSLNK